MTAGKYSDSTQAVFCIACDSDDLSLTVNGVEATKISDTSKALVPVNKTNPPPVYMYTQYENTKMYAYEVEFDASSGVYELDFKVDGTANISYIDMYIPKKQN